MKRISSFFNKKENICFALLLFGVVLRIAAALVSYFAVEYHCDEIMTFLNAASLAKDGTDITGEYLPAYFDTWVYGGQSPVATYASALFIKLLGKNIFAARLPLLLASMLGMYFFYKTACELFGRDSSYTIAATAFCAVSPWHLRDAMVILDCNYIAHFIIVGIYFLIRALKAEKGIYNYIISMLFFGLGFYCYIMSAMVIPVMLAVMFIVLLINKKTTFKKAVVSALSLTVVAAPFILFLMVVYKFIEPTRFLGFNMSMPYYGSYQITFSEAASQNGFFASLYDRVLELIIGVMDLIIPDFQITSVTCSFLYTNFIGGILTVLGIFGIVRERKESREKTILFSLSCASFSVAVIIAVFTVVPSSYAIYRYNSINYVLILLEAYGFISAVKLLRKKNERVRARRILALTVMASLLITCGNYAYHRALTVENEVLYGNTALEAFECIDENNRASNITLINIDNKESLFARFHYGDGKPFIPFDDDYFLRNSQKDGDAPVSITEDESIKYIHTDGGYAVDCDCVLIYSRDFNKIVYDEQSYDKYEFGPRIVLIKK